MMHMRSVRALCGLALLTTLVSAAAATGSEPYRRALEVASGHLRMAWSYARTGNGDLAAIEAAEFGIAWRNLAAGVKQRAGSAGGEAELALMVDEVGSLGAKALAQIEAARFEDAQHSLGRARAAIRGTHRKIGMSVFADCIWDANRTGDPLWRHIRERPDFSQPETARNVSVLIAAYAGALDACNRTAPPEVAAATEFRRLMDGALASLAAALRAAEMADADLLHRYLIEIVALDRLLFFRFG